LIIDTNRPSALFSRARRPASSSGREGGREGGKKIGREGLREADITPPQEIDTFK
jgi:hypothetical protein